MFCQKCGNEISKEDTFCDKCGAEVKKGEVKNKDKKPIKKNKILKIVLPLVLVIVCGLGGIYYIGSQPQDYHMEADELAKIMLNEEEMEKYYEDNLYIHGYIARNISVQNNLSAESNHMYSLYSENDQSNPLAFSYEKGLDDDIGSGSEVILKGTLGCLSESKIPILLVKEIDIKNREEPIYPVGDLEDLVKVYDKYLNKKISVVGNLNYYYSYILTNDDDSIQLVLNNVDEEQVKDVEDTTNCVVVGKFYNKDGIATMDVETIGN